ncbi:hypothetical protein ACFWPP_12800 [Streptomyces anulatus]
MAVLNDGTIGTLYEIGATGGIVYSSFTLDWANRTDLWRAPGSSEAA